MKFAALIEYISDKEKIGTIQERSEQVARDREQVIKDHKLLRKDLKMMNTRQR